MVFKTKQKLIISYLATLCSVMKQNIYYDEEDKCY